MTGALALVAALTISSQLQTHPTGLPSVGPSRTNSLRTAPIMEKLYEQAGKPALDFDFARYKDLHDNASGATSLINFSRSAAQSPGTYVGSDGLIHNAPVNLALYSEQFDNAAWVKSNATISANQVVAPDGKQTADKIKEDGATGVHRIDDTASVVTGGVYTLSVFFKAAERDRVLVRTFDGGANLSVACKDDGAIANIEGTPEASTNEDVGNGWRRCSMTYVVAGGTTGYMRIGPIDAGSSASYAGTNGNGIYIWGAQLEQTDPATMAPTAYIKTTSQALAAPRFDHDPDFPYVENLLTYSERFDLNWVSYRATVDADSETAPTGEQVADKLRETTDTANTHVIQRTLSLTADRYTLSFYAKANGRSIIQARLTGATLRYAEFDLNADTVTWRTAQGSATASIADAGGGWKRISLSDDMGAGTTYLTLFLCDAANSVTYDGDGASGIYLFGAQLEKASSVGQYVATTDQTRKSQGNVTTNLLTYSEMFDQWTGLSGPVIVNNADTAPDGTQTADTIEDPGANYTGVQMNFSAPIGQPVATSVYLKKITTTPTFWPGLQVSLGGGLYTTVLLNLQTGQVNTVVGGSRIAPTSYGADDAGDYWRLYSVANAAGGTVGHIIYPALSTSGTAIASSPSGTVTAWGAQAEIASTPGPYVRTLSETRSISDANAESLGLLVEEARANLLLRSEEFDNGLWYKRGAPAPTVTANYDVAPDGKMAADRLQITSPSAGSRLEQDYIFASGSYSLTVYAKSLTGSDQDFRLVKYDGTTETFSGNLTATSEWQRFTYNFTAAAGTGYVDIRAGSGLGDIDLAIFGAQLEDASFPTSYIPTVTSQTRYADVAAVQDEDFSATNLLAYSESFDVGWSTTRLRPVVANATTAPDGTLTADYIEQQSGQATAGGVYQNKTVTSPFVASVYAKAAEKNFLYILGSSQGAFFDLQNGVVSSLAGANIQATITDMGDGWYRCSIMGSYSFTGNLVYYPVDSDGTLAVTDSGGIYLWGASLTATEYPVEYVTTRNLLTNSQDFERGAWGSGGSAANPLTETRAPDGTNTATSLVFNDGYFYQDAPSGSIVGKDYVSSVYVKGSANVTIGLRATGGTGAANQNITVTTSWQRVQVTRTADSTDGRFFIDSRTTLGYSVPSDFILDIWGAQLEPGTTATAYTRTVDVVGKRYGWYEPTEGTVFVEFNIDQPLSGYDIIWNIDGGGTSSRMVGYRNNVNNQILLYSMSGGSSVNSGVSVPSGDFAKSAFAVSPAASSIAVNGTSATGTSTLSTNGATQLLFATESSPGSASERIYFKRLTYWPRRQSNSTLQVITQ